MLSEKYPNTIIKVYSTNQLGCFKGCIEICIIPTDFVDYKISELQLQNIMWRMMITRNMTI